MTTDPTHTKAHVASSIPTRRALLAVAASIAFLGAAAHGAAAHARAAPLVTVQVVDRETGQVARVWRHAGRLYIAGRPGARYSLRVTNNSAGRVLAVMSVDGINILSGETAAYDQRGYIFDPHETYEINGWRKSDREIAAFNFTSLAGSYAAATGRPGDVGVIGVAAFREAVAQPVAVSPPAPSRQQDWNGPPVPQPRLQPRTPAATGEALSIPPLPVPPVQARIEEPSPGAGRVRAEAASVAPAASPASKLGTGHGAREFSRVRMVSFQRASAYPHYIYRVEYDSEARLIASGVMPRPTPTPRTPSPFPGNREGYVPDPPYGQ